SERSHDLLLKAVDAARARQWHETHLACLAGLEAYGGTGGDVETHAARHVAVEGKRLVHLVKMIVRADLHRTVTGIGDREDNRLRPGIELDLAFAGEDLTGDHDGVPGPSWRRGRAGGATLRRPPRRRGRSRPAGACAPVRHRRHGCVRRR